MTKPRGQSLQTQAARTTKKTVLALAALLGLQAAALAYTSYDFGWSSSGDCWCQYKSGAIAATGIDSCIRNKCQSAYGPPTNPNGSSNHDYDACIMGAIDQKDQQDRTKVEPACISHGED